MNTEFEPDVDAEDVPEEPEKDGSGIGSNHVGCVRWFLGATAHNEIRCLSKIHTRLTSAYRFRSLLHECIERRGARLGALPFNEVCIWFP